MNTGVYLVVYNHFFHSFIIQRFCEWLDLFPPHEHSFNIQCGLCVDGFSSTFLEGSEQQTDLSHKNPFRTYMYHHVNNNFLVTYTDSKPNQT